MASLSAGSLQVLGMKQEEIDERDWLNTLMSWSIPRRATTVLLPVIKLIRHLESETQITFLMPEEMACERPAFNANASATKAEAI